LILDNFESCYNLENLLPNLGIAGRNGVSLSKRHILGTSRNLDAGAGLGEIIRMNPLSLEDSRELLCAIISDNLNEDAQNDRAVNELVELVGGLPLALVIMGEYIRRVRKPVSVFLTWYKRDATRLHRSKGILASHSLNTVFEMSFCSLSERASNLLSLLVMFSPDEIPDDLCLGTAADEFEYSEIVWELQEHSLVQRAENRTSVSMHRLVQSIFKNRLEKQRRLHFEEKATQILVDKFPIPDVENWDECAGLLPHVEARLQNLAHDDCPWLLKAGLAYKAGEYLLLRGTSIPLAKMWLSTTLDLAPADSYKNSPEILRYIILVAKINLQMCDFKLAKHQLHKSQYIWQSMAEANSDDLEQIQTLIAMADYQLGRYREAEHVARVVIDKTASAGHRNLTHVEASRILAMTMQATGRYEDGIKVAREAVDLSIRLSGDIDPKSLLVKTTLAELLASTGREQEAKDLLLSIIEQSPSERLPGTVAAMSELVSVLTSQNKLQDAAHLAERVLWIQESEYGPVPAIVFQNQKRLSLLYCKLEAWDQAEGMMRKFASAADQYLGVDSDEAISAGISLCSLFRKREKFIEAEELALQITHRSLDTDSSWRVSDYETLEAIAADAWSANHRNTAHQILSFLSRRSTSSEETLSRGEGDQEFHDPGYESDLSSHDGRAKDKSFDSDSGNETNSVSGSVSGERLLMSGVTEISLWMRESKQLAVAIPLALQNHNLANVQQTFAKLLKSLGKELLSGADDKQKTVAGLIERESRSLANLTILALNPLASLEAERSKKLNALALEKPARDLILSRYMGLDRPASLQADEQVVTGYVNKEEDSENESHERNANDAKDKRHSLATILKISQPVGTGENRPPSTLLQFKPFIMNGPAFVKLTTALAKLAYESGKDTAERDPSDTAAGGDFIESSLSSFFAKYNFRTCRSDFELSRIDRLKIGVETLLRSRIIWWPLQAPRLPTQPGTVRFVWDCVSDHLLEQYEIKLISCSLVELSYVSIWPKTRPSVTGLGTTIVISLASRQHRVFLRQPHRRYLRHLHRTSFRFANILFAS
jgi:hypothetical protein